ncbi:hypothetical protein RFI_31902, partial [Reticulomyxa filosa]
AYFEFWLEDFVRQATARKLQEKNITLKKFACKFDTTSTWIAMFTNDRFEINLLHDSQSRIDAEYEVEAVEIPKTEGTCGCLYNLCQKRVRQITTDRKEIVRNLYMLNAISGALQLQKTTTIINVTMSQNKTVITIDDVGSDDVLDLLEKKKDIIAVKLKEILRLRHAYNMSFNSSEKRWESTKKTFVSNLISKRKLVKKQLQRSAFHSNLTKGELKDKLNESFVINSEQYQFVLEKKRTLLCIIVLLKED